MIGPAGAKQMPYLARDPVHERVHELLVGGGVAKSNSDVNRLLGQGAVRAGNRVLDADGLLRDSDLLAGGYLLLRKGKRDFVIGKVPQKG